MGKTIDNLVITPLDWPDKELKLMPGDLSTFAPYGNAVYGYQAKFAEPIRGDPPQEASAGMVYFDSRIREEDFEGFLNMMDINRKRKDFAVFMKESEKPVEDRYFTQMRIVSKFALRFMYDAISEGEYDGFEEQELGVQEALWAFMKAEAKKYGTNFGDPRIEGKFGGDGHFAREKLSFGFMLENSHNDIYRIWSRAWLVTK